MQVISSSNPIEDFVKFVKFFIKKHKKKHTIPYRLIPDFVPHPLKVIYHEFGNSSSGRLQDLSPHSFRYSRGHIFGNGIYLADFHNLKVEYGRIEFACEDQGCFSLETEACKDNPPVYFDEGNYTSKIKIYDRLSDFLITFYLEKLDFEAKHTWCIKRDCSEDDLKKILDKSQLLWVSQENLCFSSKSYYLTEDNLLFVIYNFHKTCSVSSNEFYDNILSSKILGNLVISPKYYNYEENDEIPF